MAAVGCGGAFVAALAAACGSQAAQSASSAPPAATTSSSPSRRPPRHPAASPRSRSGRPGCPRRSARQVVTSPISHNGTVGYIMRKVQTIDCPWSGDSLLLMHSNIGLASHWNLAEYPGLCQREPGLIAGVLYRDHIEAATTRRSLLRGN